MQVNSINKNSFEGKVHYSKNLHKTMKNYAETLLDTKLNGQSVREKLAEKTYDLTFFTTSSKKAIKPKLEFYAGFNVLNPKDKKYYNARVRIGDDLNKNIQKLSLFLDKVDDAKASYDGYNTLGERIKIAFNSVLEFLVNNW